MFGYNRKVCYNSRSGDNNMIDLTDARNKYESQKYDVRFKPHTKDGPVQMKMSFEEWLQIWIDSGKWHLRGNGVSNKEACYVMGRHNDEGHYEIGNVEIITNAQNLSVANKGKPKTEAYKQKMRRPLTEDHKKKISEASFGKKYKIVTCPHCGETGGANNMPRHHFNNCKHKQGDI